jgi:NAD(P)-dependent dehydrogenase (short-subunit alcohol dehydrogenase family)
MTVSRSVLITGCSSGIGKATALLLARNGWRVYATARQPETLGDLKAAGCVTLALDVCDQDSMSAAVSAIEKADGAVGVLVNNAGYQQTGVIEEVPLDLVRTEFETNVFGLARLSQLVLPGMRRQRWGRIVNISSVGGRLTFPAGGFYHASKFAVEAISDALRFEVRGFGIGVVVIEPGIIKTAFGDAAMATASIHPGSPGSPYARLNEVALQAVHDVYRGWMSRFAAEPEAVARVIQRAITRPRPRARYVVTAGARGMVLARRLLPDRAFDTLLRAQFPTPR